MPLAGWTLPPSTRWNRWGDRGASAELWEKWHAFNAFGKRASQTFRKGSNAITWTCIRKFYKSIGRLRWSKQQWRQKAKWKQNLILDINFWLLAVVFFVRSVIWWCVCFFDCFLFIPKALVAPVRLSFCRTDILQQGRDAECNQRKRRNLMTDTGDHCWCFKVAKGDVVMGFEELHFKLDWLKMETER